MANTLIAMRIALALHAKRPHEVTSLMLVVDEFCYCLPIITLLILVEDPVCTRM
jgi:hypothetical protein